MKPQHPTPSSRTRWRSLGQVPLAPGSQVYRHLHLQVISGIDAGEWHVSITSLRMGTVSDEALARVREDFGMQDACEQHVRGRRTRHLWSPVAMEMAS